MYGFSCYGYSLSDCGIDVSKAAALHSSVASTMKTFCCREYPSLQKVPIALHSEADCLNQLFAGYVLIFTDSRRTS